MYNLDQVDITDFFFNDRYLSSFDAIVGSSSGYTDLMTLPNKNYITDRAIGQDGTSVFDEYLDPRAFIIPVAFNDLKTYSVRDIVEWLDTEEAVDFYFKNDRIKLNARLDTGGFNTLNRIVLSGITELKFIAHDPYFYEINPVVYSGEIGDGVVISGYNSGNRKSYPLIKIQGTGIVTINIKDKDNNIVCGFEIQNILDGVTFDALTREILYDDGENAYGWFIGDIPFIPKGNYSIDIVFVGTVGATYEILPRYRWL